MSLVPCPSETRLQAFVDGALDDAAIEDLSVHLDTCTTCRLVVGMVQPVPLEETTADTVGRYVLRRVLGKGGMGVVYEAVDPELHRVVALKVLQSGLGARQQRLLAEAEAMARLAHPNVVSVHDIGRFEDRVFIVMELVKGASLRAWLAQEPRSVAAVLDVFMQVAEGLTAAHEAGLIHRDVKPENVFVADDGRVRVGDFGLAISDGSENAGDGSLAYMAPEQRRGEAVDARADQYGFCVALEEALGSRRPRWLRRIVARGRADAARDRFATMRELAEAIRRGRGRARLRSPALGAGAAAVAAGLLLRPHDSRDLPVCKSADVGAVWNDARAKHLEEGLRGTGSPLADDAWQRTARALGAYAESFRATLRRACEAPAPRDEAERRVVDQKAQCLTGRLETLRAVTSSLEHVDPPMVELVPAMLALLPRLDACEDVRVLAALPALPAADRRASVESARRTLAQAAASLAAGRYEEALARATEALGLSAGYLPAVAEAYLAVGTAQGRLGHVKESEQALEQAVSSSTAAGAPAYAVRAWIQLMHFVGFEGKRFDDGYRWSEYARAALTSLPEAEELAVERLAWHRAMLLEQRRFTEALVVSKEELALVEKHLPRDHAAVAIANDGLASVLAGQCRPRDALASQEACCAALERSYGAEHPQLALCLGNQAALHAQLGDHVRAVAMKRRALGIFEHVTGHPNHVAMAHRNMARSLLELGRLEEAKAEIDAAAALSKSESDEVAVLVLSANLARRRGQLAESSALLEQALARASTPARRVEPLTSYAETSLRLEHLREAERAAADADEAARTTYGSGSCRSAEPLRLRAEALVQLGRREEALPYAERAVAALAETQLDPQVLVRAEETLRRARAR